MTATARRHLRSRGRALVALLALAALLVSLAGCGGGHKKTIPTGDAATLIRQLRKARDAAGDAKKCAALQRAVSAAQATVAALPTSVDHDTCATLTNGVNNLDDTARQECANATTNTQTTTTPTTTTPTTNSTPTTNTQPPPATNTQTTPTNTTPTTPTNTTPTTPGNGGANPGNSGTAPGQQKKKDGKKGKAAPPPHGGKHDRGPKR